jgi:hypothetical protein
MRFERFSFGSIRIGGVTYVRISIIAISPVGAS